MKYTIELTEAESKALAYVAVDPEDWILNAARVRAKQAMDEIFQSEVNRMLNDPAIESISADKEAVVLAANVPSLAEKHAMLLEERGLQQ